MSSGKQWAYWARLHYRLFISPAQLRDLMIDIALHEGYVRWPVALCRRPVWVSNQIGTPLWPNGPTSNTVRYIDRMEMEEVNR